jgi:iron-sulfur cluster assembly protein
MNDCKDVKKVFVPTQPALEAPVAPVSGVQIADIAAQKIKLFVSQDGKSPADYGLYVRVKKDGCSGLSYDMEIREMAPCVANGDKVFAHDGAWVAIDKTSYFYVTGSVLTYTEALTGSGFSLQNPNIKRTCSCGSSFAV